MKPARTFLGRLLLLVGVVTLPWVLAWVLDIMQEQRVAEQRVLDRAQRRAELVAWEVDITLQRNRRLLDFLSTRPEIRRADGETCRLLMVGMVTIDPLLMNVAMLSPEGRPLCVSVDSPRMPATVADYPEFREALTTDALVYGRPRWGPVAQRLVLPLLRRVHAPDGQVVGVLLVTLDLVQWSEGWRRYADPEGSTVALQDREGIVLARHPDAATWIGRDESERLLAFRQRWPEGRGVGGGVDGVRRFYALAPVQAQGLVVIAGLPEEAVLAPVRQQVRRALLALVALSALVLWLAWRLSQRLVAPLAHLAGTARAVAEGHPQARADENLPGEFRTVAIEFNRMLDGRDRAQARLAESERRFREMLDTVELFAMAVDREGRITYANGFFLQRTRWPLDELIGASWCDHCMPPGLDGERDAWLRALRDGTLPAHNEAPLLSRGGEPRWVRWSSTVLRDERGLVLGRASIGEDITEQRLAERQVLRLQGFLTALSRTQRAIIHRAPRDQLLREACEACVGAGQARIASAWLKAEHELVAVAWSGPAERLFGGMPAHCDLRAEGFVHTLTGRALHAGLTGVCNDIVHDPRAADWRRHADEAGVRAQAVFPLRCAGEIVGVLLLHMDEPNWFDDALVELLHQLTDDLAFALDNLQREQARLQAQRQAATDHRRFKTIFDASPTGMAVRTLHEGRLLDVNAVFAKRVGRPREALIGRKLHEDRLGMSLDDHERLMAAMQQNAGVRDFEARVRGADGAERIVLINGELIDYDGQPAVLTISHDITERRRAEQALQARERQLAGIVESAMDAIITVDASQRVLMFNRAACEMFRVSAEDVLGRPLDAFVPRDLLTRHQHGMQAFVDGGREQVTLGRERRLHGVRADGERFAFEAAITRQGDGDEMTMTAVIHDLTERIAAEAAREARLLAEVASQAKTEFLSRMSHELRTPLNAMLGFAQLLSDDPREPMSPRQLRHLGLMREAGWHLLALIDDVLDVSRIEAGELDMQLEPVALRPMVESALSVSATLAARAQVQLRHTLDGDLQDLAVRADATRLRQVVLNLLSNGCKYNRAGGEVVVQVAVDGETVRLDVVDNGLGMDESQQAHLFEPFNRLGRERGPVEGTGIGLHLTRQLVLKMGGTITAESAAGLGTRMSVRLPRARLDEDAAVVVGGAAGLTPGSDGALEGHILYVEDNPVNLMLVEQFLLRWPGVQLSSASTGAHGVEQLAGFRARGQGVDLVLLDMQLPDMHGIDLLLQLRQQALLNMAPVVALSASAMPDAVDAALAAGAVEYWTKPLNLARLGADLRRFLRADN
ncbi:PAS domain S-box protein [Ideonella sp. DXS29W]|uniref:histidine kinase n=1 Tax=Ideonella lacteola TaxID=2984193 RepID=A0ABU9BUH9_9BURK